MCLPQPLQVGFLHVGQSTLKHIIYKYCICFAMSLFRDKCHFPRPAVWTLTGTCVMLYAFPDTPISSVVYCINVQPEDRRRCPGGHCPRTLRALLPRRKVHPTGRRSAIPKRGIKRRVHARCIIVCSFGIYLNTPNCIKRFLVFLISRSAQGGSWHLYPETIALMRRSFRLRRNHQLTPWTLLSWSSTC